MSWNHTAVTNATDSFTINNTASKAYVNTP
jgi:hypothetical protein